VHSWSTFGAWTSHGQTWTHWIHHGPDLGEVTTFPLIVFPAPKCHFILGLSSWSPKIPKIGTFTTLKAHNVFCRPPIDMRFKAKL